jgi:hypothetical protein
VALMGNHDCGATGSVEPARSIPEHAYELFRRADAVDLWPVDR